MERSYTEEIELLKLGEGQVFHGEGILAVTKALLQSGVSYVGGYQGAPVTALLDVLVSAKDLLGDLGVHVEACSNEASAAAMLAASLNYPVRGAVTWKSIVGTNVASDALSNLASVGVKGGALIIVGEDYGEGASVIQERSLAFALKSTLVMLDPRPDLADDRRHGRARLRDLGSLEHARDDAAAHPRLPRAGRVRRQGQRRRRRQHAHAAGRARAARLRPPRPSAGDVPAGGRQGRPPHPRRARLHRRAQAQRDREGRHRTASASSCRAGSTIP